MELAHENLTTEEIKNTLLLATINEGKTAWQMAALEIRTVALQKIWYLAKKSNALQNIWNLAKDILTTEEKNLLLLATKNEGITPWYTAVMSGKTVAMKEI
jgi:hypothetical protein